MAVPKMARFCAEFARTPATFATLSIAQMQADLGGRWACHLQKRGRGDSDAAQGVSASLGSAGSPPSFVSVPGVAPPLHLRVSMELFGNSGRSPIPPPPPWSKR